MILRKRAEEIVNLVQKAEREITLNDEAIAGDIHIGAGETDAIRHLARAAGQIQQEHPQIRIHISSGGFRECYGGAGQGIDRLWPAF